MLTSLLFLLTNTLPRAAIATAPPTTQATAEPQKEADEFSKRKKEAGKDVSKLWKLYEWCKEQKKEKEAKSTLKDLLKLEPTHKEANIALGNLFFDGKWFENQAKIEEYKKQKVIDEKLAQGLLEYKGEWVPKEDVPFLEKGLVKDDIGNWVDGEVAKKLKEGFVKQDLTWISPAEKENIEKGLWKCGDKWLSLADADKFHAELDQEWRIPFERFNVWTTCERDLVTAKMKRQLDPAIEDLDRIYGVKPSENIDVYILRSLDQYNAVAAGSEEDERQPTEMMGMSSAYNAHLGDIMFDDKFNSTNMGVSYWDTTSEALNKWGVHNVRHAIGQSYAEALDPSSDAITAMLKTGRMDNSYAKKFYAEKKIPAWFRYGAAAYVERYYKDTTLGIGGNPTWTKEWSVANLLKAGGLRPLKQVFECKIKPTDAVDTSKLINETGLVMAFIVDGNCAPVVEKHKALQAAFKNMKDRKTIDEANKALEAEVIKHEVELRKFGGL